MTFPRPVHLFARPLNPAAIALAAIAMLGNPTAVLCDQTENRNKQNRSAFSQPASFIQKARLTVEKLPPVTGTPKAPPDHLRDKPVIVTFFASWCPPCREEFAHLNKLARKFADSDLRIIAINVHEAWDENDAIRMQKFIGTTQPVFPAYIGSEEIRRLFGGISRIPTVYGFNRAGELRYHFIHKRNSTHTNASYDELHAAAQKLLAEHGE